jgi:hypothetical protein
VRFGIDATALAALLTEVIERHDPAAQPAHVPSLLASLHLEELVLARACIAGHDTAWEIFLTRYRAPMYEAAYKITHDEATARALVDSLYAELYGVNQRGDPRTSKLHYYLGRGSLAGWLRTVVAQEYVNQYRRGRRETSLGKRDRRGQAVSCRPSGRESGRRSAHRSGDCIRASRTECGRPLPVGSVLSGSPHASGDCQVAARA